MRIHYYSVSNCTYSMYEGKPAIFAPEGADAGSLTIRYYFFRTHDGRWCHYLTNEENDYIRSFPQDMDVRFDYPNVNSNGRLTRNYSSEEKNANILCIISLSLLIFGLIMLFCQGAVGTVLSWIASLVLMIIVRVDYPDNLFGKILMISYIVLAIIAVIMMIIAIIAFIQFINSCFDSINNCNIPG